MVTCRCRNSFLFGIVNVIDIFFLIHTDILSYNKLNFIHKYAKNSLQFQNILVPYVVFIDWLDPPLQPYQIRNKPRIID